MGAEMISFSSPPSFFPFFSFLLFSFLLCLAFEACTLYNLGWHFFCLFL